MVGQVCFYEWNSASSSLVKKLFYYNLAVFYLVQHYLVNFYSPKAFGGNIYATPNREVVTRYNGLGCIRAVKPLNLFNKILAFFAHCRFTLGIPKIGGI